MLDQIVWKDHRKQTQSINLPNLGGELADLFKYVLCLFQLYGFSPEEALQIVMDKTEELDKRHQQEFSPVLTSKRVIITDMDGTLGDWRTGFLAWWNNHHPEYVINMDPQESLNLETDVMLPYPLYRSGKEEFEMTGGYLSLPPYPESLRALQDLSAAGVAIYAYTARPQSTHTHIWMDSLRWLDLHGLGEVVRELRIGGEQRIDFACSLLESGCQVAMLEDDPTIAIRAAMAGIPVWLKDYPYNRHIEGHNIHRVGEFNAWAILEEMDKELV